MATPNEHVLGVDFRSTCREAIESRLNWSERRTCAALLISCAEPGVDEVPQEKAELGSILKEKFDFVVETFEIPEKGNRAAQDDTEDAVRAFRRTYDQKDNLMLVYYGGHGKNENEQFHFSS